ncbi:hypothetical protein SARC_02327 [Sphaeroforma arctica JP610]|uniref:PX domain-containing protein n=1 Tax=Sphaeroforma arctica JP610 TaxID=667725 RepID=A0A0L0G911_9EUKA|nr:hypothetical protein SARC_02327 [Sphaeroforma arctica JP610]KNC85490.1 hypothetical protein SARC_02327 [Sphaeroforma arctica JP610]|eukprot:XP_014159392.1 hypothetical protein SARC_02327 [Sphaeroforma arctica JP610]
MATTDTSVDIDVTVSMPVTIDSATRAATTVSASASDAVNLSEGLNNVHLNPPETNSDGHAVASDAHERSEETVIVKVKAEFETQTIFFGLRRRQYATDADASDTTHSELKDNANSTRAHPDSAQGQSRSIPSGGASGSAGASTQPSHDSVHGANESAEIEGKGKSAVVVDHGNGNTNDVPPPRQNASGALKGPFRTRSGRIVAKSSKRFVRSFGQFQQLHDYLLAKYPAKFVPSLPTTPFSRLLTDPEHIDKKKRRVMVFLDRIQTPGSAFAQDSHVLAFVHPGVFAGTTILPRSPTLADEVSRAGSVLSSMFGSFSSSGAGDGVGDGHTGVSKYVPFMSAFKSMYSSARRGSVTDDDQNIQGGLLDFDTLNAGVTHVLSDCNAVVESITESDTTRRETAVYYARLAQSLHHLSRAEPRGIYADLLALSAHAFSSMNQLTYLQARKTVNSVGDAYTQLIRDIHNVKRTIDHRNEKLKCYEDEAKHVRKTSRVFAVSRTSGSGATASETDAAERAHTQAMKDRDEAKKIYMETQSALTDQWASYDKYRVGLLDESITSYVDTQYTCAKDQLAVWETLLNDLTGEQPTETVS